MSEDSRVDEPSSHASNLKFTVISDNHVKVEVTCEADTFKKTIEKLHRLATDVLAYADGYDQIAKIAQRGPVPISEQVPVSEDQTNPSVGVSANSDKGKPWFTGGLV